MELKNISKHLCSDVLGEEMKAIVARKEFSGLVKLDKQGKRICLVCFYPDETLCHRSIIAGIVLHIGVQVQGVKGSYHQIW